jgi:hypothetical protein
MAKPGTTHVIEIETGIGEPAFIPLTLGSELQPISIGKKGMWRIESGRVLDVHAFVYFDGASLFLQSADESQAASVDGYRVGKAWTELHAPCKIEIGAARLRFRSLADAPEEPKPEPPRPAAGMPATEPEPGGGYTRPGPVESRPVATVERPLRPTGQLLSSGTAPVQAIPQSQHPPGLMNNAIMSGAHNLSPNPLGATTPQPLQASAFNLPPMPPPAGGMGNMSALPSGSMSIASMGSGGYGAMGSGSRGAPTVQTQGGGDDFIAKYKELSPPKRLLVLMSPFCLIAAAYLLLFDDDEPPPEPVAMQQDAGPPATQCPAGFVPYTVPVNGQYPCVPLGTPMPGASLAPTPLAPTVPATAPTVPTTVPPPGPIPAPAPAPAPGPSGRADAGAPVANTPAANNPKTLERQAVDALAVNDYGRAAAIYDALLAQSNPKNPVYAEAARILRQKADAGAP